MPSDTPSSAPENPKVESDSETTLDQAESQLIAENNLEDLSGAEKLFSAIGYMSFLCVLPLLKFPNSDFAQFHGKQGLVLTIASLPISFVGSLLGKLVFAVLSLGYFGVMVYAAYQAIQGQRWPIPGVKIAWEKLESLTKPPKEPAKK